MTELLVILVLSIGLSYMIYHAFSKKSSTESLTPEVEIPGEDNISELDVPIEKLDTEIKVDLTKIESVDKEKPFAKITTISPVNQITTLDTEDDTEDLVESPVVESPVVESPVVESPVNPPVKKTASQKRRYNKKKKAASGNSSKPTSK